MNSNKRDIYFNGRIYIKVDNTISYQRTYLLSHTNYELIGTHNFTSGQCVDGLYELAYQWQTDYKNMGKKWEDCTPTVYSMANHFYRRIVAVALPTPAPVAELPKEAEGKAIKDFIGVKVKYDADGQYLWGVNKDGGMQMIAELRGWGAIQNLFANKAGEIDFENAGQFQDILGNWIADQLTTAINQL